MAETPSRRASGATAAADTVLDEPATLADGSDATATRAGEPPASPVRATTERPRLAAGDRVGRYVIERVVGEGGMGVVYAAYDPGLDRRVALKLLRSRRAAAHLAPRLAREAQAMGQLDHPNVVTVHDTGEADGHAYVAMQLIDGRTLDDVLAGPGRPWREVVAIFAAAGRGLAAAHTAGLVHRDFKPSNVLVDVDGRARVTDFGLARAVGDDSSGADPDDDPEPGEGYRLLAAPMTRAGAVLGTPAYMAPEQHRGERATPASDQFSFCVALWEALYAQHPFVTRGDDRGTGGRPDHEVFAAAVARGEVRPAPRGRRVPRRVERALRRGLRREPAARWPSMAALLATLEPPPLRRVGVLAAVGVAAIGGATVALMAGGEAAAPRCASLAAARIDAIWTPARRDALTARFVASGRPYAAAVAAFATRALDDYAAAWTAMRTEACAATRERAEQSQLLGDRRMRCLDERATALEVVVARLADAPDPAFIERAAAIVGGLPAVADCGAAMTLTAVVQPLPDAALAARLAPLEAQLAEARVRRDAGQLDAAVALLDGLRGPVTEVGYAPLLVDVQLARAELAIMRLEPDALARVTEVAAAAQRAGLDRDAARALTHAVRAAGVVHQAEVVAALSTVARGAVERTGDPALALALQIDRGRALTLVEQASAGEAICREALATAEKMYGTSDPRIIRALDCRLEALVALGRRSEVRPVLERAMALARAIYGEDHPVMADYLTALANNGTGQGRTAERRQAVERALAIRQRAFGEEHPKVVDSLMALAGLLEEDEDLAGARALLERALAMAERTDGPDSHTVGRLTFQLGSTTGYLGDREATHRYLARSRAVFEGGSGDDERDLALVLLMHSQFRAAWGQPEEALVMTQRAIELLDAHHDPRAGVARSTMGKVLMQLRRFDEAIAVYEQSLARLDVANTSPQNVALTYLNTARALAARGRDPERVRDLAEKARAAVARGGGTLDRLLPAIDELLRPRR